MRRFQDGFLHVGYVRGVPVRVHWATPIGALLLGGLKLRPLTWTLFAALVLLHELAHAAAARRLGVPVYSADLMPYGGQCQVRQPRSQLHTSLIAAAGPMVHVTLFVLSTVLLRAGVARAAPGVGVIASRIGEVNFYLAMVNLIPLRPLDGAEAWKLVGFGLTRAWRWTVRTGQRARLAWLDWRLERRARRGGLRWAVLDGDEIADRGDGGPPRRSREQTR